MYLSSEVKPLMPKPIRRDPRRMPIFCKKRSPQTVFESVSLQSSAQSPMTAGCCDLLNHSPDFIVRGTEIGDSRLDSQRDVKNDDYELNDEENKMICQACLREMDNKSIASLDYIDKNELCMNFDQEFHMDASGNFPFNLNVDDSLQTTASMDQSKRCDAAIRIKRSCSPTTSQVIRITMNNKKRIS